MSLYEFSSSLMSEDSVGSFSNAGKEDVYLEVEDRYGRKLKQRQPIVFKIKAMASGYCKQKYPQGAIVNGQRLNRNLFSGVHPWTYPDWGGQPITELPDCSYEIIAYIDKTYPSGKYVKGHLYLIVAEATEFYHL